MALKHISEKYYIINNQDEKGHVLTYSIFDSLTITEQGEFNTLKEARTALRKKEKTDMEF